MTRPTAAFTLIEMLVVIAIIGILATMLMPAVSKAKDRGHQTVCRNNLRQIGIAFHLYHGDFRDQFPAPGSQGVYGPQPEDWIWWQQDRDISRSTIVPHVASFTPKLFTCPKDGDALFLQTQGHLMEDLYRYSYSLTSYSLQKKPDNPDEFLNPGMSTIITRKREVYPFRATTIRNPSGKIMLVEESRDNINDPRWVPGSNPLASRHVGQGVVTFADGHVEAVKPKFAADAENSYPDR